MTSFVISQPAPLFHLVPTAIWEALPSTDTYYPATYTSDGFTHLTADPALLLEVANHFYTAIKGDFVVLELDSRLLADPVKYEPAASVGNQETKTNYAAAQEDVPLFPHLYGGIPKTGQCLVGHPLPVSRDASSGQFLSIAYPIAQITANVYIASSAAMSDATTMNQLVDEDPRGVASLRLTSTKDATTTRPMALKPVMVQETSFSDDDELSTEIPVLECLNFIDVAVQAGHRVVVHSTHGSSRASSIVLAQLMFTNGTSLPETLPVLRQKWPRARPRPYFMSQLAELDQGDGHDPSVALRAVADILQGKNHAGPTTLAEDEIENVMEFDDEAEQRLAEQMKREEQEEGTEEGTGGGTARAFTPITDDDDDALRRAAAEAAAEAAGDEAGAATTGLDPLPAEHIEEMASTVFQAHTESVCCIAASPVSTLMVSGGCDDTAYVWDATSGQTVFVLGTHTETVAVCGFNFDGTLIATGTLDGSVNVWNVADGQLVQVRGVAGWAWRSGRGAVGVQWTCNGRMVADDVSFPLFVYVLCVRVVYVLCTCCVRVVYSPLSSPVYSPCYSSLHYPLHPGIGRTRRRHQLAVLAPQGKRHSGRKHRHVDMDVDGDNG